MKAFITGGGGFIGKELAKQLLARGDDVVAFQRGEYPELVDMGASCVRGDITDKDALVAAVAGADCVFHIAAYIGAYPDPKPFERINVEGTANVIAACVENGVTRLVYCSSPSVAHAESGRDVDESVGYAPEFLGHYPRTKADAERLVLTANGRETSAGPLLTTAVRPHLVLGPGDPSLFPRIVSRIKAGRLRVIGDGDNMVDVTAVDNAALAHVLAADALARDDAPCAGKPYFITNGEPIELWPWLNGVLDQVGLPRVEKRVSLGAARFVGKTVEGTWKLFGAKTEPPLTEFIAVMLATDHTFSLANAKRDLGYEPQTSMAQLEEKLVPWLKAELEAGRL